MFIFWVVPSLSVAILLLALAYGQARKPRPGSFFSSEAAASGFAVVITSLLAFSGIGIAMNFEQLWSSFVTLPLADQGALAAILGAALVLAPVMMRPALRARRHSGGADILTLPTRDQTAPRDLPPSANRPLRRAA